MAVGSRYGGIGALAISSDFTASVPNLDVRAATGSAAMRGTFVTIAGQNMNQLTATTEYNGEQVTFDASARQPERTLKTAGALIMHPDHQEVHLNRLLLASQGISWQTPPGVEATVRYANDAVTVSDLSLVNGTQQISASGSFGRPVDLLTVSFADVDVGTIDALLLRPPQLSGVLNGTSTLSGSKDAPKSMPTSRSSKELFVSSGMTCSRAAWAIRHVW